MPYDDPNLKEFDNYYQARSASKRERAENWAVAIGLQKVDGLTPSRYLIDVAKRHIEGDISGAAATRMIDKYYETKAGHDMPEDVKEADRVSARINEVIEEDGFNLSPTCLIGLHGLISDKERTAFSTEGEAAAKKRSEKATRKTRSGKSGQKTVDRLSELIASHPHITQAGMVAALGITRSTVQKHLSNLKSAGKLRRVGPDKGGHWEVIG